MLFRSGYLKSLGTKQKPRCYDGSLVGNLVSYFRYVPLLLTITSGRRRVAKREQFYHCGAGGILENDDYFYLAIDDQGNRSVVHRWERMNPYLVSPVKRGNKTYSVQEFLTGDFLDAAKESLRQMLEPETA